MNTAEKLLLLGYCPQWLDEQFLNLSELDAQVKLLQQGHDANTEHYRYASFLLWIDQQTAFSDTNIEQLLLLAHSDSDMFMASSALVYLLGKRQDLTDTQFALITQYLNQQTSLQHIVKREEGLRQLRKVSTLTLQGFKDYMTYDDAVIQEYLLHHIAQNNFEQLDFLAIHAKTKRLRNMAKQQKTQCLKKSNSR